MAGNNPEFHVYDSNQVSINFAGIPILGGFAEGELIRITMVEDAFKEYIGADGSVSRAATHDRRADVEIRLQQTSISNVPLAALLAADRLAPSGVGVGALEVFDLQGTSLHFAGHCWIVKEPDAMYDREVKERVWKIRCADMHSNVGSEVT